MTVHSRWQRGTVSIREHEAASRGPRYSVDDMEADILDLFGLLRITSERLAEMDYGTGATRNQELVSILSLSRIACRISEAMVQRFSQTPRD